MLFTFSPFAPKVAKEQQRGASKPAVELEPFARPFEGMLMELGDVFFIYHMDPHTEPGRYGERGDYSCRRHCWVPSYLLRYGGRSIGIEGWMWTLNGAREG